MLFAGLGEEGGDEGGSFFGDFGGLGAESVEDEIDNGVGEECDDETENSVENGVFGVGDFLAVAAGDNVADTAPNQHDDGNEANDVEDDIGELIDDATVADQLSGHTFGTGGLGAFLDATFGHDWTGAENCGSDGDNKCGDETNDLLHRYNYNTKSREGVKIR